METENFTGQKFSDLLRTFMDCSIQMTCLSSSIVLILSMTLKFVQSAAVPKHGVYISRLQSLDWTSGLDWWTGLAD